MRRADRRRRRRADRRARRLREEPRARVPDRRRPARRRRRSGVDRQGGARRRAQDDVRLVQRRRRGAAARRRAVRDRRIARSRRSARRRIGCASLSGVRRRRDACERPPTIRASTISASSCARSAISTRASIASCSRRRAARAARSRWRRAPAFGSACSAACCSVRPRRSAWARGCPAWSAASATPASLALYLGVLFFLAVTVMSFARQRCWPPRSCGRATPASPRARACLAVDAGWVITAGCLVYLTLLVAQRECRLRLERAGLDRVRAGGRGRRSACCSDTPCGSPRSRSWPSATRRGRPAAGAGRCRGAIAGRRRRARVRRRGLPARADRGRSSGGRRSSAAHRRVDRHRGPAHRDRRLRPGDLRLDSRARASCTRSVRRAISARPAGHRRSREGVDDDRDRRAAGCARRPRPRDDAARGRPGHRGGGQRSARPRHPRRDRPRAADPAVDREPRRAPIENALGSGGGSGPADGGRELVGDLARAARPPAS